MTKQNWYTKHFHKTTIASSWTLSKTKIPIKIVKAQMLSNPNQNSRTRDNDYAPYIHNYEIYNTLIMTLIHGQVMRPLRHGGSHFKNQFRIKSVFDYLTIGIIHETMVVNMTGVWTFFNNYSNHPRMCVLSTLCGNVDKHSPLSIWSRTVHSKTHMFCPIHTKNIGAIGVLSTTQIDTLPNGRSDMPWMIQRATVPWKWLRPNSLDVSAPWTFSSNIGLNMLPSVSFMSCLNSLLYYSTGEFQACNWFSSW